MPELPLRTVLPDISPIAYGCMGLGGPRSAGSYSSSDYQHAVDVVNVLLEEGINFFDHADIYSAGKAEQVFGQLLKEQPHLREQIYIQSKCGIRFADEQGGHRYDLSYEHIMQSVDQSLQRLNCDYLDILLLHRPDPLMDPVEVAEAFRQLKESGKVCYFGVSNMNHAQIRFLQNYLDEPLVANQVELSLAHRGFIERQITVNDSQGQEVDFIAGDIEYCQENQLQIQAWSPLARGLFDQAPQQANLAQTQTALDQIGEQYHCERSALLLAWLMRHSAGIQPIIGTTNIERIRQCAKAVDIELTREQWYQLLLAVRGHTIP